ncbi:MAG: hypothetical protein CVV47_10715 [Spirochaetae bacterium HGW-Spirochaetae-3]|jgi:hypothetical protein|nr:MAG: hypothetical protein CVV47_10715 [Spirochaetae bacterium HGW-Spirochaetae-3]
MIDRSGEVFGNEIARSTGAKAGRAKAGYLRKFGAGARDAGSERIRIGAVPNATIGRALGVQGLAIDGSGELLDADRGIVIGNIRMGYGHYRIAMAMASVIKHRGFVPYWFDLNGYDDTVTGRVVSHLDDLYSFGSRLSQKSRLFNRFFWEPLNYEGFKKLSYNAADQKVAELYAPLCAAFPPGMPMITTHGWPAQAALHAGMTDVVNAVVDNWPMALHLAEGALHAVQGPSAYLGYRLLREMRDDGAPSVPMPASDIRLVGHYVDHEIVSNLESDCAARIRRIESGAPRRVLMSIGGAGAQLGLTIGLAKRVVPLVKDGRAALYLNFGDHADAKERFDAAMSAFDPSYGSLVAEHVGNWAEASAFAAGAIDGSVSGVHAFLDTDKFAAVYCTNLLMRSCDVLVTKPSELAYYPVPKLMTRRVGGHERWGAIRAAELGDGTYEVDTEEAAAQALTLMLLEDDILRMQNEAILRNAKIGLYDGCYRVVDLALERRVNPTRA